MLKSEPAVALGKFDCDALTARVLALDEAAWRCDPRRQQNYDVHAETQSIILLFCKGWPKIQIERGPGWDQLAAEAVPVMEEIVHRHYPPGGTMLRAMMARLPPGGRISRHKDEHPSFALASRIHVPLVTNPDVEFVIGNERFHTRAHQAFELNNLLYHQVTNSGACHRIHFIFDYAPAENLG